MIIDVHTHTPQFREHVPADKLVMNTTWRPDRAVAANYSWNDYMAAMGPVDRSIVFGIAWEPGERVGGTNGVGDAGDVADGVNNSTAAFVRAFPERLIGFMAVHPHDRKAMDEMERSRVDLGLRGVKLGANYQIFDPLESRALAIYQYAEKHGLPVLFHIGTSAVRMAPMVSAHPLVVDEIAMRYPDLKIIMAHMGHPWTVDSVVVARKHPNVFTDISGLFYRPYTFYEAMIKATEWNILDKVLFGSDFPIATPAETIAGLRNINAILEGTSLPRVPIDRIEQIIHRDSLSLLGLS
ncbi:amidohydrolase family protein [Kaistia terrae]|uniref:Amidohydrolase family protein n=1 Tax=Kaistia terrae TaxID=537017 RepID=A0ABW0Q1L6_9HYPH|nr:amidohydrolase family protein [Kaistia terrae]MCX5579675.1 amidohydrolase family protein [Kaistia terrae]